MILSPFLDAGGVTLYAGDCIEVMRQMPENSVDAIVTDPPYGLEFMGKGWDSFRVDDPGTNRHRGENAGDHGDLTDRDGSTLGGRLRVGYGGGKRARTYRCTGCGKRDQFRNEHKCQPSARWANELIDPHAAPPTMLAFSEWTRCWALEAYRVLKPGGHLLAFAGTRTYHRMASGVEDAGFEIRDCIAWMYGSGFPKSLDVSKAIDKAAGAERHIEANAKIEPFGSTVRCATCGKSLGSQAANCRCDTKGDPQTIAARKWSGWGTALKPAFEPVVVARKPLIGTVAQTVLEHGTGAINVDGCRIAAADSFGGGAKAASGFVNGYESGEGWQAGSSFGRWPANVTLDEDAAAMLDEQSGDRPAATTFSRPSDYAASSYKAPGGTPLQAGYADTGGASRFFYTAKASKKDRNTNGANNTHPTVKPTTLMRWLIRLVTPPGGIILDPFGGSGSTGVAARAEGVRCILIEREAEYLDIIRQRLDDGDLFSAIG